MARPRTTLAKLPKDWRRRMMAVASEGGSAIEVRAELKIGRGAWATLQEDSPEFLTAIKEADDACAAWWERSGRKLAIEGGGNSAIWIFNMKNRFGWRDKFETAGDDAEQAQPVRVEVSVVDARKRNADA